MLLFTGIERESSQSEMICENLVTMVFVGLLCTDVQSKIGKVCSFKASWCIVNSNFSESYFCIRFRYKVKCNHDREQEQYPPPTILIALQASQNFSPFRFLSLDFYCAGLQCYRKDPLGHISSIVTFLHLHLSAKNLY